MIVAVLALFVALGGPAQAERLINGARIKADSVGSKQIKDRSLKFRDFSAGAVGALTTTPNGSIGPAQLAENGVTTRAIAPDSVQSGNVADNSLTAADLDANSVGADEISEGAVGQSEIRTNGVSAAEIADNSIDGAEIFDGSLSVRDVARQVGTLKWPIKDLLPGECEVKVAPIFEIQIAGDHVLVSPVSPWPDDLVYTVNGTSRETDFKLEACNRGKSPVAHQDYMFNYAVIGF